MQIPSFVLITGASSGIGRALAHEYAALGSTLFLIARGTYRLERVAAECQMLGANATAIPADVTDRAAMAAIINRIESRVPLDLVIANAGGGDVQPPNSALTPSSDTIIDTNVVGLLATIHPVIEAMRTRRNGQIAIMSSLAGYLPLKASPAYSAAKASTRFYGLGLRSYLKPENISVSVITPGFVATPATAGAEHPLPFLISASTAARKIRLGLQRKRPLIAFPLPLVLLTRLATLLPRRLINMILP
ncbi:MAG: SDR family NAD(P)-dependent oxidoreductase [Alphaproteobacteria bacterium]